MKFRGISLLFALLIIGQSSLFAQQALDIITFGNTASENSHSLTAAYSTTYTGQLSQTARSFNPRTDAASYVLTGNTYGIYGGYCTFKVAVSKTEQNYFSVKMSGDEFDSHQDLENGRILLSVQGTDGGFYEIGRRSGDGESVFIDQSGNAILPGTFWYRTSAIPRKFTTGKDSIVLRLKASGRFYSYGTIWNYNTYQRALLYPTVGVYKGFSHTNPMFSLPATDLRGTSKMTYTKASTASKLSDGTLLSSDKATILNYVTSYMNDADDYIPTYNNNNYNEIEFLAQAYNTSWATNAYKQKSVTNKIIKLIDNHCRYYNADNSLVNAWGGAYGRPGYAMCLVWDAIKDSMNVNVNLGLGTKTRAKYWADLFYASFYYGMSDRRTITNQVLESIMSVWGANMGLQKLGDSRAWSTDEMKHLLYESIGLEEWRGQYNFSTKKFQYDIGGKGFYMMTNKGTSHEPGWVSQDCYGNLGPKLIEIFDQTGDSVVLNAAVKLEKAQLYFHIPGYYTSGTTKYKQMQTEGVICWRNVYHPGKCHYVDPYVATVSKDPVLLGVLNQMNSDGQLMNYIEPSNGAIAFRIVDAYNQAKNSSAYTTKDPTTPGQPDFAFADEENGIVSAKRGTEQLFLSFYRRAYDINYYAVAHLVTDSAERVVEFKPTIVKYISSGVTNTDDGSVEQDYTGINSANIDNPVSAYKGDVREMPLLTNGQTHNFRCIANFYATRFGNYVVALNTTARTWNKTYAFNMPAGINSAYNIGTKTIDQISGPIVVAPGQTVVYFLGDSAKNNLNNISEAIYIEPTTLPGIVESENYDLGGNGVGYSDNDGLSQNIYRSGDLVDLEPVTVPADANYWVMNTNANEWLNYTVDVSATDKYTCTLKYKTSTATSAIKIKVDDVDVYTTPSTIMNTYGIWRDLPVTFNLTNGSHVIQVYIVTGGMYLDKMTFTRLFTALNDVHNSKFSISPNPANNYFYVNGVEDIESNVALSMYSADGRLVKKLENVYDNSSVFIGDLAKGIYFVKLYTQNKTLQNIKLIKD